MMSRPSSPARFDARSFAPLWGGLAAAALGAVTALTALAAPEKPERSEKPPVDRPGALQSEGPGADRETDASARAYPYGGPAFHRFVRDSYHYSGSGQPSDFYDWMESGFYRSAPRYPDSEARQLSAFLVERRAALDALSDPEARAEEEVRLGQYLHRMVKTVIPKFSLDRGFEFFNVVRGGERQCFLQSVLIAGMLQASGVDAGTAMVFRNHHGVSTNNGHAVTLVRLANGTDTIVDASDAEPQVRHAGLFASCGGYRFVVLTYREGTPFITRYRLAGSDRTVEPRQVQPLDIPFLRSQFSFYRGERTPGGLLAAPLTPRGIERAAAHLRKAVEFCPQNPLAVYTLGRVMLKQGRTAHARSLFSSAIEIYSREGWVPHGPRQLLAQVPR